MPVVEGILAASVYNPADGTSVQIRKISAGSFDFSQTDADYERSPTGSRLGQADVSRCGFEFLDDGAAYRTLRDWQDERTRVSLVAIGRSVAIQWYETDLLDIRPVSMGGAIAGRADRYAFELLREGHGRHAIYKQQNLLGHLRWRDLDSSGIADGYTSTGTATFAWDSVNGEQDITGSSAGAGIYTDIVFPIGAGFSLRASSEATALHVDTTSAHMSIEARTFGGSSLATSVGVTSGVGRFSTDRATLATAYVYRVMPGRIPTGVSGSGTVSVAEPALRVDGQSTYTQG
jgi:hypothetical protein